MLQLSSKIRLGLSAKHSALPNNEICSKPERKFNSAVRFVS